MELSDLKNSGKEHYGRYDITGSKKGTSVGEYRRTGIPRTGDQAEKRIDDNTLLDDVLLPDRRRPDDTL